MEVPKLIAGEDPGTYRYCLNSDVTDAQLLHLAKMIPRRELRKGSKLTDPTKAHRWLQTLILDYPYEVFGTLLMGDWRKLIAFEQLYRGTMDSANIYHGK